jgi:DNA-binding response OmpR family regulator
MASHLNILVIEDNDDLRETTVQVLMEQGHKIDGVACAEDVSFADSPYDLFLIDLNLPGEDGLSLSCRIRECFPDVGIIMMTARRLPEEIRLGYDQGADIYLTKPVSLDELCGAVSSLARRLRLGTTSADLRVLSQRLLLLSPKTEPIVLSPREVSALSEFATSPDQRLEYWRLTELFHTRNASDPKAALEIQILRLRKKLLQAGATAPTLQSIRGWGYQLCVDVVID